MRLGIIESMELDRVNFTLTLRISDHPRRGESRTVTEDFDSLPELLARYDFLVRQDEALKRDGYKPAPCDDERITVVPEDDGWDRPEADFGV